MCNYFRHIAVLGPGGRILGIQTVVCRTPSQAECRFSLACWVLLRPETLCHNSKGQSTGVPLSLLWRGSAVLSSSPQAVSCAWAAASLNPWGPRWRTLADVPACRVGRQRARSAGLAGRRGAGLAEQRQRTIRRRRGRTPPHTNTPTSRRREKAPASWARAIPKIAAPSAAGDFRPITVLLAIQKVVLRTWMHLAAPWLSLREPASHGFRSSYQCPAANAVARHVLARRSEWGLATVAAKLDIAKAYDTVTHDAIQERFERRGLPIPLQAAYWREHDSRTVQFRTSDGLIAFIGRPRR